MQLPNPGDRVRLIEMPDDPNPVPAGSEGTVVLANSMNVVVKWDSGRGLNLIPGVDSWEVIQ